MVKIDCGSCAMYKSEHCGDCLVTAVVGPPRQDLEIDDDLEAPLQLLARAALVPELKFRPAARPRRSVAEGPAGKTA